MTSILDLTPSTQTVQLSIGEVDVPGISLKGITSVLLEHPELIAMLKNRSIKFDSVEDLLGLGVGVVSSFLSAGCGYPGNKDVEEKCANLLPGDALDLGQMIFKVSFPGGMKDFLSRIETAIGQMAVFKEVPKETVESLNNSQSLANS